MITLDTPTRKITCADGFSFWACARWHDGCKRIGDTLTHLELQPCMAHPFGERFNRYRSPGPNGPRWAYVPVEVVEAEIQAHGGLAK